MIVLSLAACAAPVKVDKPRAEMSQRERDSTIAGSGLPGAGVVRKAINMTDIQNRQSAMVESAAAEN